MSHCLQGIETSLVITDDNAAFLLPSLWFNAEFRFSFFMEAETMWISRDYCENLGTFHTIDGIKAIALYSIYMLILLIQGFTYTTNLSVDILNKLQIAFPLLLLAILFVFMALSNNKLCTVGLNKTKLFQSLLLGIVLAVCLVIGTAVCFRVFRNKAVGITYPLLSVWNIFIIGAFEEEITFRGYIQTRLTGIIRQPVLCSCCTALLFLAIHYPVRWVVGGFSLNCLSLYYVVSLIILHFACDFVYNKTNCLWGAIVLHLLYNIGQSMLVL